MSYTPLRSIHRFSVFYRTSTATAAIGSDYPFQAITSVPASRALASYRPSAGALVLMNLMTTGVAYSTLLEFSPAGASSFVAGGDMYPSLGASASNCEVSVGIASGASAIQISIDNGFEVNDTIVAGSTALIVE